MRKLDFFRLPAPAAVLGHLGAISLKLPNFLTTSQDVTKGADQAKCRYDVNRRLQIAGKYAVIAVSS